MKKTANFIADADSGGKESIGKRLVTAWQHLVRFPDPLAENFLKSGGDPVLAASAF